ncbi:MAG: hypothetical protein AAFZ65_02430, partial [Planctomycetota bacterium]
MLRSLLGPTALTLLLAAEPARVQGDDVQLEPAPAAAFERADAALEAICELPPEARTYANTVEAIDDAVARLVADVGYRALMAHVSPISSVRERGAQ